MREINLNHGHLLRVPVDFVGDGTSCCSSVKSQLTFHSFYKDMLENFPFSVTIAGERKLPEYKICLQVCVLMCFFPFGTEKTNGSWHLQGVYLGGLSWLERRQ